jgi:hypothetical protein
MKKVLCALAIVTVLCGCSCMSKMDNTPTKKVENFLKKYQSLDDDVISDIDTVVLKETKFSEDQKTTYKEILKDQFKNMTYEIKDETVDGDNAVVEVEIKVKDFYKVNQDANDYLITNPDEFYDEENNYSEKSFIDYRLKSFKETKETVKYTLYLSLTKKDGEWNLNQLTTEQQQKLLGIYAY